MRSDGILAASLILRAPIYDSAGITFCVESTPCEIWTLTPIEFRKSVACTAVAARAPAPAVDTKIYIAVVNGRIRSHVIRFSSCLYSPKERHEHSLRRVAISQNLHLKFDT